MKLDYTRKELLTLSKEELVDDILIPLLSLLGSGTKQPSKTSRNSSKPPSTDQKPSDPEFKNKGGAQKGHPAHFRKASDKPDRIEKVIIGNICPNCGLNHGYKSQTFLKHQVLELVTLHFELIEYQRQKSTCGWNNTSVLAGNPVGIGNHSVFGPKLNCFILVMYYVNHLSISKIQNTISELSCHKISNGAISSVLRYCSKIFKRDRDEIMNRIKSGDQVGVDETGWRVCKSNWWLWTFQNESDVLYMIEKSRGSDIVKKVLGEYYDGTIISDCLRTYWDATQSRWKQKCLAHLIRKLIYVSDITSETDKTYAESLLSLFREAIHLKNTLPFGSESFLERKVELINTLNKLLNEEVRHPEEIKVRKLLIRFKDEVLTFLEIASIAPTNNRSEQALRSEVIHRKICQGNKSLKGKEAYEINASVIATFKRRGEKILESLVELLKSHHPKLVPKMKLSFLDTS